MGGAEAKVGDATDSVTDWRSYPDIPLHPILAAALIDFQQHGYHGTTVRGIAARVGLTMPSLYYHYGSKEGVLFALLDVAMDDLQVRIEQALEDAGDDSLTRFKYFITVIASHNTRRRDLASLHGEFRFLSPAQRSQYVAKRAIVERTLEELLRAGIEDGLFEDADPHFTSRVLLGMLNGIHDWYSEDGPLSADEIAERYTHDAVRLVSTSAGH